MKFLIAGLGSIGRRHFRNLIALGETDIVLYRTFQSTLPDDDELAGYPVETDLVKALAHNPAAVIVSNPTALHLDVAIPAAEAGCHIFLEKPISHSMERVDTLQAIADKNGVKILVGFQFRYHPGLQHIKVLLENGSIGRVVSVRAHWGEYLPGWHPWEDHKNGYAARADLGGGVILTLCHPIDYLRMLLGDIAQVWCFTNSEQPLGLGVEDTAEIGLKFVSSVTGSIHLNYIQRPAKHDLEIVGTGGTIYWDAADNVVHTFQAESMEINTQLAPEGFERNQLFIDEMKNFLSVCRGEAEPVCTLDDGVRALVVALQALESAKTGNLSII